MPKILVNVSEAQKALWVRAAHGELVSLSEWIRRRCDGGLEGGGVAPRREGSSGFESQSVPPPSSPPGNDDAVTPGNKAGLVSSAGSFRPDPKVKK